MTYFLFDTRKKIGFDEVVAKIRPESPYGKDRQDQLSPLDAAGLQAEFAGLKYTLQAARGLKPRRITELRTHFSRLPVLEESLSMLEAGATLHDIALFNVRKFMVLAAAIEGLTGSMEIFLPEVRRALTFSPPLAEKMRVRETGYSFSIGDFAPEELKKARERVKALKQRQKELQSQKIRDIREQLPEEVQKDWYDEGISVSKGDPDLLQKVEKLAELKLERESFARIHYRRTLSKEEQRLLSEIKEQEEVENKLERQARRDLSRFLRPYTGEIQRVAQCLGWMDWALARVTYALEEGAVLPEVTGSREIYIQQGAFPPLQQELAAKGGTFFPLSMELQGGVTLITGANMGGKTVALKILGLLTALAQHGIPVPAARMRFCPVDHLFMSGGEDLLPGLSSFGSEVEMFKALLLREEKTGLFLLDEPARGTNPEEGSALVAALVEHFSRKPPLTVVTTHFNSVAMLAGVRRWQVRGLRDVKELDRAEDISTFFDFSIEPVPKGSGGVPQNALKVAQLLGLPPEITQRAQKMLAEARKGGDQDAKIEPE
jgi:DNA mismatch repair protein MutS2